MESVSPVVSESLLVPLGASAQFTDENSSVVSAAEIKKQWPDFLEALMRDRPNLGTFLSSGVLATCDNNQVNIRFGQQHRFQFSDVTKKQNREEITSRLAGFFGAPVELHITLESQQSTAPPAKLNNQLADTPASMNDELDQEPIIQTILDVFDGELLR